MATKAQVIRKLNALGLTTEGIDGDYYLDKTNGWFFDAWLPKDKTWSCTGSHCFCVHGHVEVGLMKASEFWDMVMEDINAGVENSCDTPYCDTCDGSKERT